MRLSFEDVSYSYEDPSARKKKRRARESDWGNSPDAFWALRHVSFEVKPGEFLGIAGHTGSGKSTLIQHMNGLVHPTEGRVLADGADLADKKAAAQARRSIGLVFQYPENQLFAATVNEDVAFGPRNMKLGADEVKRRVREALLQVNLNPDVIGERSPFDLSGGQQRRVAFAGVLAMEPEILILDEPVAGLDPHSRADFLQLIRDLHASGITVVMVSHSMEDLASLCDRILVLSEGEVFALGTPAEVFSDPAALKAVGLGAPAPEAFAGSLRDAGFLLPRGLYDERSLADDIAAYLNVKVVVDGEAAATGEAAAAAGKAAAASEVAAEADEAAAAAEDAAASEVAATSEAAAAAGEAAVAAGEAAAAAEGAAANETAAAADGVDGAVDGAPDEQ